MGSPEIPNLFFDYIFNENLSLPGGDLPPLDPPGLTWQSHSLTALTPPRYGALNVVYFFNLFYSQMDFFKWILVILSCFVVIKYKLLLI